MSYNGIAYPSSLTTVGVAVEATRGTPVAPSLWIPVKGPKYKPNLQLIPDETLQGVDAQVQDLVEGLQYDSHGWTAPIYLDTFPFLVRAELGSPDTKTSAITATTLSASAVQGATSVSITGTVATGDAVVIGSASNGTLEAHILGTVSGAGPYTCALNEPLVYAQPSGATVTGLTKHQFSLLNNSPSTGNYPPSVTITDFDGEEWRQMSACQIDELTIKGNGTSLSEYTCTWMGNPSITPSSPSSSFTGVQSPAAWTSYLTVGGTFQPALQDWEFNFKRGTKEIPALTGLREYFTYFPGPLQATGKFTFLEQSGSPQLTAFLEAQRTAFDFTLFDIQNGYILNIHATACQYKTAEIDRSKEYVEVPVEFQMLPNTTDATAGSKSPVLITVANGTSTTY
ncbi:MAG: hypothetical protein KGL39_04360 [Patescibacteria group bacterium]|nr:hypothetical protein [Patescibacteria group bacterium]